MTEVISVRFKNKGKIYFFNPAGLKIPSSVNVIVETAKGLEYAECTYGNHFVEDSAIIPPLRPVVRIATEEDDKKAAENSEKEKQAFVFCQKKIEEHHLDMKLVDVEFSFEGSKILFFFTSDGRVDFRELVKDLASVYKTRIELRQIGVRDEARMLGGLGICGKPFCCEQFLDEFHPVSIKMAKTQGLSLNPVKISGTCGRLMCCLKYEETAYEDIVKRAPKIDAFVETPSGKGSVISVNLLRGNAKVRLEDGIDTTLKTFTFDELDVLGGKARRAEYIAAKAEGKLAEAGFSEKPPLCISRELKPAPEDGLRQELKASPDQRPVKKSENVHKKEEKQLKPQGKKPAKPEKTAAVQKEEITPAGGKGPNKKAGKRHHRGGKGRNKNLKNQGKAVSPPAPPAASDSKPENQ